MRTPQFQSAKANFASRPKTGNAAHTYLLWVCLIAWAISFFLPSARTWIETTVFGWQWVSLIPWAISFLLHSARTETEVIGRQAALETLLFLLAPTKGAWFPILPHVLSVFANFFMLWAPFQVRRLKETNGRKFALAFTFATAIPVTLLFLPPTIVVAFEFGFVFWTLAILGASAWFCWMGWRNGLALLPSVVLAAALLGGVYVWSPSLKSQQQLSRQQLEEKLEREQRDKRYHDEELAAKIAIADNGLLAFNEPMTIFQEEALKDELGSSDWYAPGELIAVSKHYQDPRIMMELALRRDCPPEALEVLLQHTTEKEKMTTPQEVNPEQIYITIAKNANASPTLLLKMLGSGSPIERAAALGGSKLPLGERIGYLEKGCSRSDEIEIRAVAESADTPVEVMACLAKNPRAAAGLAANPNTPTALLEQMSRSLDPGIANEAKIALAQRKRQGN